MSYRIFLIASLTMACGISAAQTVTITEYPVPPGSDPILIANGPDGALWYAAVSRNRIGRITTGGSVTEFLVPTAGSQVVGITAGPDGALWFTERTGNKIGRITTGGSITEFNVPTVNGAPLGITAGPDGALWFTEISGNKIGRVTTGGSFTEFPIPTFDSAPELITTGPDGALWFTEFSGNKIGRITTSGGITEYPVLTPGSLTGIVPGPDGALWFSEQGANKIGRITTGGSVTEYPIPTADGQPFGIAVGPDNALWFTELVSGRIGRITTAGSITEYDPPTRDSFPFGIVLGPDGALWFTENHGNNIGRVAIQSAMCSYGLSAQGANFTKSGGSGSVNVITNSPNCSWSVTGGADWLTITSNSNGSGNGPVNYLVSGTASGLSRSVTLTIAGLPYTISQAGLGCAFSLSPANVSVPAAATIGSVTVDATAPDCPRTAVSNNPAFIAVTFGASGAGPGSAGYNIAANPQPTGRNGSITIGGQIFAVSQRGGAPCTFSLPQSTKGFPAAGSPGFVAIATQIGCNWTASTTSAFVTITAGSGSGPGMATFTVAANTGPNPRSATIATSGGAFIVQQAGTAAAVSCAVNNVTPATLRSEGRTELVRDVTFTCTGSAPEGGLIGDISLRLNAGTGSRRLDAVGDATEALLLLGEPASPQLGANAFAGRIAGPNVLRWPRIRLLPSGIGVSQTFRITNVRVDASPLGAPMGSMPPIVATVLVQTLGPVPVSNAMQTVGQSARGSFFLKGLPTAGPAANQVILPISFREGFSSAFKLRVAAGQDPSAVGTVYNSESGYVNTALLGPAFGLANAATRFTARISNVPANVQLSASQSSADGRAVLVGTGGGAGYTSIPLSGGAGLVTWEALTTDPLVEETLAFSLLADNPTAQDLTGIEVTGLLAPASLIGVPSATAPIPRFRDFSVPQPLVSLRVTTNIQTGTKPVLLSERAAGSNITFVSMISNAADVDAPNVVVRSSIPSTVLLTGCVTSMGTCETDGNDVRVVVPTLPSGSSVTVTVTGEVNPATPPGTVIENSVSATSDLPDSDPDSALSSSSFSTASGCFYSIDKTTAAVAPTGDLNRVQVITAPGCPWSSNSGVDWITFSGPIAPSGPGLQFYSVAPNAGAVRTAILTIADQAFQVTQAAASCVFSATASNTNIPAGGGSFTASITSAPASCAWSASTAPAAWISLPLGNSGAGNGALRFDVAANTGSDPRTGTVAVSGTVIQLLQQRSGASPTAPQFIDVPLTDPYFDLITLLRDNGVTTGCTPTQYCPTDNTTRGQMAVFIIRSLFGGDSFTFPNTPFFTDVPSTHPYFRYIQKMRDLGITSGCTATAYCPDDLVTRGQMAVFLIRGRLGISGSQPFPFPASAFFTDVPPSHPYFSFIQKMKELGITSGCTATAYCPDNATTRGQMAVFLIRAFFTP